MALDDFMRQLADAFCTTLEGRADQLASFHRHGVQVEGWLKGEMLLFLDQQKDSGAIEGFDREVLAPLHDRRKRVDLKVSFGPPSSSETALIELKHWVSEQKGTAYKPGFYFGAKDDVGLYPDASALSSLAPDRAYLIVLVTANPGRQAWDAGVQKFNTKFGQPTLISLSDPNSFPDTFFLGLLKVTSKPLP